MDKNQVIFRSNQTRPNPCRIFAWTLAVVSIFLAGSALAQNPCPAYPPPPATDTVVTVSTPSELLQAVRNAQPGTTVLLNSGTYQMSQTVYLNKANLSVRSASGNRDDVILDGNYRSGSILQISADHVTVANLTIRRAYYHPIHVGGDGHYVMLYNLTIFDGRQQFLKVNPSGGKYNDFGTLACSHFELTDAGRQHIHQNPTPGYSCYTGGLDAHQAWGWTIRDNTFKNIYCTNGGLAEHCVHFWRTSREPTVERNTIIGCARGIGFGLGSAGGHRTYDPDPTAGTGVVPGHIGGTIKNNFIYADIGREFDCGICLEQAWNVTVEHNTIYSVTGGFNVAIDSRFQYTNAVLKNNLYYPTMSTRNGAQPVSTNNLLATSGMFVDLAAGNLHIKQDATSVIDQAVSSSVTDDIDSQPRGSNPDIGADEWHSATDSPPAAPENLKVQP